MHNRRADGFNTKAKKSLGQHFLTSEAAVAKMVAAAGVTKGDIVLEIGPGRGVLTRALLDAGAHVVAVELDRDVVAPLTARFDAEVYSGALKIIEADFLTLSDDMLDELVGSTYKVVANIPYYVTNAMIERCLTARTQPQEIAFLVQKEVAERIVARDGKGSILSVAVRAYCEPKLVSKVSAGSFNPPPKVDSAILALRAPSRALFERTPAISEESFFRIVKAGFAHKRKMLAGNLSSIAPRETIDQALIENGLPATIRAEDLSLENWRSLTATLTPYIIGIPLVPKP